MADYTLNKNLYKWKTTDTKRTTITEMAKNAEKIDDYLTQIDVEFGSVKTDLAQNTKHIGVSVKDKKYGAKGDGVTDDTVIIQSAFNSEDIIIIPAGTYMINAVTKLSVPANKTIIFEKGAIFKAITNGADNYTILNINSDNVTIYNPEVVGDRSTHTGTTGEWGHGIVVTGYAKNVKIYNPVVKDCWGDGFVVYGAENLYVENLVSDNNRRQGLTITYIKKGLFVNPKCINTNGVLPQAGIDIEPNSNTDVIDGLTVINPRTENNLGSGIIVSLKTLNGSNQNVNITIENHVDVGSMNGLYVGPLEGNGSSILEGKIKVNNPNYFNSNQNGIEIRDYSSLNTPIVEIDSPLVVNPNVSGQTSPLYGTGISLFRLTSDIGVNVLGNVFIKNPIIIEDRATPKLARGIYCVNQKDATIGFENCVIENPRKIVGVTATQKIDVRKGVIVRDNYLTTKLVSTVNMTIFNTVHSVVTNDGATSLVTFILNQSNVLDSEVTFINNTSYGLQINPQSTQKFIPLSPVIGKYIQTTQIGASITLKRVDDSTYRVVNMVGTWTVQP